MSHALTPKILKESNQKPQALNKQVRGQRSEPQSLELEDKRSVYESVAPKLQLNLLCGRLRWTLSEGAVNPVYRVKLTVVCL